MKERHKSDLQCLKCNYCQRTFVRTFNLRRHYRNVHKLDGQELEGAMVKRGSEVNRQRYEEARKPV